MGKDIVNEKTEIMLLNENSIRDKIYIVRGQKVMLDVDLAEIYGYTTKAFNQQVKNNLERFDEDFRFQLTKEEVEACSRSKNLTLNINNGRGHNIKYLPYAFTEQGIYMLMTVLKGDLAVQQSKALIRIFKKMKDYMIMNQGLIGEHEFLQLSMQVTESSLISAELRADLAIVEEQMAEVVENLNDVVYYSELAEYMKEFGEPHIKDGYLVYNGEPFRPDLIFALDYGTERERIFLCGASSKDGGRRISSVLEDKDREKYHAMIDKLQKNPKLVLK